jgi:hypothetical protein
MNYNTTNPALNSSIQDIKKVLMLTQKAMKKIINREQAIEKYVVDLTCY